MVKGGRGGLKGHTDRQWTREKLKWRSLIKGWIVIEKGRAGINKGGKSENDGRRN